MINHQVGTNSQSGALSGMAARGDDAREPHGDE